jgi:DNA-binding beta-propeller fold protein YncE
MIAGSPTGLAFSSSGKLVVADTHYQRVLTYTRELTLEGAWGRGGTATGGFKLLADAREGRGGLFYTLDYATDLARIQVWRGSEVVRTWGCFGVEPGQFRRPMALAIDAPRGEILVADAENHRIQVLALEDGRWKRTYGGLGPAPGQLKFPYDVEVDEEGRAWVAEFGNHRLQVFDREGRSVATWGTPGRREGELAEPWGVALAPHGLVYLLDSGNDRIYELQRAAVLGAGR